MKKCWIVLSAVVAVLLASCTSTGVDADDQAVSRGVHAWNSREPAAAKAYWTEIKDAGKQKKYLNFITLYDAGVEALDSTDSIKATNEPKLLAACNNALNKFNAIEDSQLKLPANVCEKGANLSAERIDKLLVAGKLNDAKKMHATSVKVYGENPALTTAGKQIDVVNVIATKKANLSAQADKAAAIDNFDQKVAAYDAAISAGAAAENEINSAVSKSGTGSTAGVSANVKAFKNLRQNIAIQRAGVIRDKAYEYKDQIGEEFARQPAEGSGTGKNGAFTSYDILAHYQSVQKNIDKIYNDLVAFAEKYPKEVSQDVLDDVKAQRDDLYAKIAQIKKEIAVAEEIASRGKTVMPLMIGLFNPDPKSSAESKKSRPAKFSGANPKKADYWWGMVSIPKGQMNDLVITVKDNRTVRVFNENTKSGKNIAKDENSKGLQDLVNRANKVGNSWPVMNVGSKLKGSNYFFEVSNSASGKDYSGEVVVYSSFITRSR